MRESFSLFFLNVYAHFNKFHVLRSQYEHRVFCELFILCSHNNTEICIYVNEGVKIIFFIEAANDCWQLQSVAYTCFVYMIHTIYFLYNWFQLVFCTNPITINIAVESKIQFHAYKCRRFSIFSSLEFVFHEF